MVSEIVRADPDPNLEFLSGVDKKGRLDICAGCGTQARSAGFGEKEWMGGQENWAGWKLSRWDLVRCYLAVVQVEVV